MDVRLSEAEWEVMEVLWSSAAPLMATDIAERVPVDRAWSLATVKSLLSRLLIKGALASRKDGRKFLYSPAVERGTYVGKESRRFVGRMFGGRLSPLIARLAEEQPLDERDVAEIEALLARLKS